jgi:antitoxin component YwqK of YwqJK toxin-antitoxin module
LKNFLTAFACLFLLCSCTARNQTLSKVHLTSQKGLTQTLTTKERLKPFEDEQFLLHQPHLKVVRVFESKTDNKTIVTTYYPSGHLYQYLECKNNQAFGIYKEWASHGIPRVIAQIVGGAPDLEKQSMTTWVFDGESKAFDGEGNLEALFYYHSGLLEGECTLFFPGGETKELLPYRNGLLNGETKKYKPNGFCVETKTFQNGVKHGPATLYWDQNVLAANERYIEGKLITGLYFNPLGKLIAQVKDGNGFSVRWADDRSYELVEFIAGTPEGCIRLFDSKGFLLHEYIQRNGVKDGKETLFYEGSIQPKLQLYWKEGLIHGLVSSWYPSGKIESEREMCQNKKHGLLSARYENFDLMLIEEYDRGFLVKGQYFKKGLPNPISSVDNGNGFAHIFDGKGFLIRKIEYLGGKPVE